MRTLVAHELLSTIVLGKKNRNTSSSCVARCRRCDDFDFCGGKCVSLSTWKVSSTKVRFQIPTLLHQSEFRTNLKDRSTDRF